MQKLGKNLGGYFGERIEIQAVLRDLEAAGHRRGWASEVFLEAANVRLFSLVRRASSEAPGARRVYISTGVHGDEPAGPLAALQLVREDHWPPNLHLWLSPCLNPLGFALNRRENPQGLDLNRQYRQPAAPEVAAHIGWLNRQPAFDFSLCLHEDWESHGFYVYELNPDRQPSLAERIVRRVARVCPVDQSELIEGRPAKDGIIRPGLDPRERPDWPEAFYLISHKTRLSCTLEAPSDFPLSVRVAALVAGVRAALDVAD